MARHKLTLTLEFDTNQKVPDFHCKGPFDATIGAFDAQMRRVLNTTLRSTSLLTVDVKEVGALTPEQQVHGERIQARGRHNGTSEA